MDIKVIDIPFLYAIVMDMLIDDIHIVPPWNILFANDVVFCGERIEVQNSLEKWRQALHSRGMKISRKVGFE